MICKPAATTAAIARLYRQPSLALRVAGLLTGASASAQSAHHPQRSPASRDGTAIPAASPRHEIYLIHEK